MCTVQSPLPHGKISLSVFSQHDFTIVLQHANNPCLPYIDSTTVLSDIPSVYNSTAGNGRSYAHCMIRITRDGSVE